MHLYTRTTDIHGNTANLRTYNNYDNKCKYNRYRLLYYFPKFNELLKHIWISFNKLYNK